MAMDDSKLMEALPKRDRYDRQPEQLEGVAGLLRLEDRCVSRTFMFMEDIAETAQEDLECRP